jgi:phage terminase large subunit
MINNFEDNQNIIFPEQFSVLYDVDPDGNRLIDQYENLGWYGGRGGTKSHTIADFLLDEGRHKKLIILCGREIQKTIKHSVHKLLKAKIEQRGYTDYKVTDEHIKNTITGTEFFFMGFHNNFDNVKSVYGVNYCWIEEAQSLSLDSLIELIPTIREDGSKIIYTFNRKQDNDPVWEKVFKDEDEDTFLCKINIFDVHPMFQSKKLLKQAAKDKKADYEEWLHIWMGEPRGQLPNSILSRFEVLKAMERHIDVLKTTPVEVGADIAREGDDRISFFKRQGNKFIDKKVYTKLKTYDTESKLKDFIGKNKKVSCKIDMGNMGSGIFDHLKLDGYNVTGINFGAKKTLKRPDLYHDIASEMWFEFAENIGNIDLIPDEDLKNELCSRQYFYKNVNIKKNGKIVECIVKCVEPKKDYKKRQGKSPDLADGAILCYYTPKQRAFPNFAAVG